MFEKFFLIKELPPNKKKEIIRSFQSPISFSKGEIIYSQDKFNNALGYILEGTAIATTNNGEGIFMKTFCQGDSFGVASLFGGTSKYVSNIVATSCVKVIFINEDELKNLFIKFPKTAENYITFLSNRIRFLNNKLSLLSCNSAEDTVLKYLLTVTDDEGYAKIPKNMTFLSKTLGIGRATLYRCLDCLENNGYIIRKNNLIKVIKNEKDC